LCRDAHAAGRAICSRRFRGKDCQGRRWASSEEQTHPANSSGRASVIIEPKSKRRGGGSALAGTRPSNNRQGRPVARFRPGPGETGPGQVKVLSVGDLALARLHGQSSASVPRSIVEKTRLGTKAEVGFYRPVLHEDGFTGFSGNLCGGLNGDLESRRGLQGEPALPGDRQGINARIGADWAAPPGPGRVCCSNAARDHLRYSRGVVTGGHGAAKYVEGGYFSQNPAEKNHWAVWADGGEPGHRR